MSAGGLVAALPMYDFPWVAAANDALWAAIGARLGAAGCDAPPALTRGGDFRASWRDPALVFGQACAYPYFTALIDSVALIATPRYGFPGCEGAWHRSLLVAAKSATGRGLAEFRGARAAINSHDSNTGANVFRAAIAPVAEGRPFFSEIVVTGAHEKSLEAVAAGRADLAAIDCVSFALIDRGRPELIARVAVVGECPPTPSLPFIASARLPAETHALARAALFAALADPALAGARATLGLVGARVLAPADYRRVAELERDAIVANYPRLA